MWQDRGPFFIVECDMILPMCRSSKCMRQDLGTLHVPSMMGTAMLVCCKTNKMELLTLMCLPAITTTRAPGNLDNAASSKLYLIRDAKRGSGHGRINTDLPWLAAISNCSHGSVSTTLAVSFI